MKRYTTTKPTRRLSYSLRHGRIAAFLNSGYEKEICVDQMRLNFIHLAFFFIVVLAVVYIGVIAPPVSDTAIQCVVDATGYSCTVKNLSVLAALYKIVLSYVYTTIAYYVGKTTQFIQTSRRAANLY